ncbi:MAG: RluA family pseudouridine synthase [Planctomycetes bacterium]|nr:RluA family pseudouridine synthase [Planctomycetota bacterium]
MTDRPAAKRVVMVLPAALAGQRLDQALVLLLPDYSRAFLKKLLDGDGVRLDGRPAKPSLRVKGGEEVTLTIPEAVPLLAEPEAIPLRVLFEDDDLIVIDKRAGMVAHPSPGHRDGTLVNALLHHYGDSLSGIGGVLRPGIVHRLDRDTSGCLAAAKTDAAHRDLIRQFMAREVEKRYLAITDGVPRPLSGRVEGGMGRNPRDRKRHALLRSGGRPSLTLYETRENYGGVALVECQLLTGRTHQARVHLAHVGAPVLCDRDYGRGGAFTSADLRRVLDLFRHGRAGPDAGGPARELLGRQALHAWRLGFRHPRDGRRLDFEAPLPADMLAVLEPLRAARQAMEN